MDMAALEMLQPMLNYGTEDNVLNRVNKILNRVKMVNRYDEPASYGYISQYVPIPFENYTH